MHDDDPHAGRVPPTPLDRVLAFLNLRRGEGRTVVLSAAMFFFILSGYFFIRPVREAFGIERGMDELYSLFFATMLASLAINPLFSWLVSRFDRRIFLPVCYGSIVVMLVGFSIYRASDDAEVAKWAGRAFFVWLSVVNLFMTGLFWSLMADSFGSADSRRVFPTVAVGGTLGALLGSAAAWGVSGWPFELFGRELFETGIELEAPQMMLVAAAFVAIAGLLAVVISFVRPAVERAGDGRTSAPERRGTLAVALDGVRLACSSRYILAIAAYIALVAIAATFLYFSQSRIVLLAESEAGDRIGAFASIDFWTQFATVLFQLFLTARLMRWIGTGWTLAILPMIVMASFLALGAGEWLSWSAATMLGLVTIAQASFRAAKYAIMRPARESLFTVLSRDEKYKAKSLVDTFAYRAGDAAGAGADLALTKLANLVPSTVAVATFTALAATVAPIAIVMAGLALWLGSTRARLERESGMQNDQSRT